MIGKPILIAILLALCYNLGIARTSNLNDSVSNSRTIKLWSGNFNSDYIQDSILGISVNGRIYAKWICWGLIAGDSVKKKTEIIYPDWKSFKGSYNILKLDRDGLEDLMVSFSGDSSSDTSVKRANISVVIFAQDGIDTLKSIQISKIKGLQQFPLALDAKQAYLYKEIQKTNINEALVAKVNPIFIPVSYKKGLNERIFNNEIDLRMYPNPAVEFANLELSELEQGDYTIEIRNLIGELIERRIISLKTKGNFLEELKFTNYVSGSYYLKVSNDEKTLGIYPFVVSK